MAKVEQIGTIPVLTIGLGNEKVPFDPFCFDSQMSEVTGGLNLMDSHVLNNPPHLIISQIKYAAIGQDRGLVLYGFPEQILFMQFVTAYSGVGGVVDINIRSIGHIRVVTRPESVERIIMGASAEVLQRVGFVSPGSSERFRKGRLRQELGAHFIFDDWTVGKNEPRSRLSGLKRLLHF